MYFSHVIIECRKLINETKADHLNVKWHFCIREHVNEAPRYERWRVHMFFQRWWWWRSSENKERDGEREAERFRETRWAQRNRAQGPGGIWNIHQDINYPLFNLFKWEVMRLWFMAFVLRPVCLSVCPSVCLTFVYLQRGSFGFTWRPTVKL